MTLNCTIMNEKESIDIIMNMIDRTKENLRDQSVYYLVWGWSIFLAATIEYGLITIADYPHHYVVWPIAILFAVAITIFLAVRASKEKRTVTYADRALSYLWATWSAVLLIVLVFSASGGFEWGEAYLFVIALYGMGSTVSGGILNFKPLIYGGIISLVLALVAIIVGWYQDFPTMLLLLAVSIFVSFLVPGFLLRKS